MILEKEDLGNGRVGENWEEDEVFALSSHVSGHEHGKGSLDFGLGGGVLSEDVKSDKHEVVLENESVLHGQLDGLLRLGHGLNVEGDVHILSVLLDELGEHLGGEVRVVLVVV